MKKIVKTIRQFLPSVEQGEDYGNFPEVVPDRSRPDEIPFPHETYAYYFYDNVTVEVEHEGQTLTHTFKEVNRSPTHYLKGEVIGMEEAERRTEGRSPFLCADRERGYRQALALPTVLEDGSTTTLFLPFSATEHVLDLRA
jgi:hypothetical protein